MCGIAGLYNFKSKAPVEEELFDSMCRVIAHRGPNDQGVFIEGPVALGMRRLSIIDLSTGQQPVHNEDRTIWTVFNGEIYNFRELRDKLTSRGHQFYTKTDTEVIVHAYEEYGEDCVDHLRGMFAFAVWDARAQKLFIARDRFGIKPLHYAVCGGALLFGSELKSLLQHPALIPEVNFNAFNHYLSYLYTPGGETILKGVYKLPPGHTLTCDKGEIKVRQYWDIKPEPDYSLNEKDVIDKLKYLLKESVQMHLVSDVPLGAFLSGGVDSSTVVATMMELLDRPVKTFSIGFPQAEFNETQYAREVATLLGTEHYELEVNASSVDIIKDLIWFLDEPMADSSAIPTYLVSQFAREQVTVVLSGDGGDELFGGYQHHFRYEREAIFDKIPLALRQPVFQGVSRMMPSGMRGKNLLRYLSLPPGERVIEGGTCFDDASKYQLLTSAAYGQMATETEAPLFPAEYRRLLEKRSLPNVLYLDLKRYLPLDILTKVDRMSMAHSLEARVPLLDPVLAEFVSTIPPNLKVNGKSTKYILKEAMRGILPNSILERKKQGFALPIKHWLKREWKPFVLDHLLDDTARARGIMRPEHVQKLFNEHGQRHDHSTMIWMLLVFELWCREFIDKRPKPKELKLAS